MMRYRCSNMGNVRALTMHKGEVILCSDQGIYVSKNFGLAWMKRNGSDRKFTDIQDMGSELIATTSDGRRITGWFLRSFGAQASIARSFDSL